LFNLSEMWKKADQNPIRTRHMKSQKMVLLYEGESVNRSQIEVKQL
jgi:hypothetical protein